MRLASTNAQFLEKSTSLSINPLKDAQAPKQVCLVKSQAALQEIPFFVFISEGFVL